MIGGYEPLQWKDALQKELLTPAVERTKTAKSAVPPLTAIPFGGRLGYDF